MSNQKVSSRSPIHSSTSSHIRMATWRALGNELDRELTKNCNACSRAIITTIKATRYYYIPMKFLQQTKKPAIVLISRNNRVNKILGLIQGQ